MPTNRAALGGSSSAEGGSSSSSGGDSASGGGPSAGGETFADGSHLTATGPLAIEDLGFHEVEHGQIFSLTPKITGDHVLCRKDLGHDDVLVDPVTGTITWDTSSLLFGRGFHIRIKCTNAESHVYASTVVHVDKSGSSRLHVAGEEGVSPYVGVAGKEMKAGDTVVFLDGTYPVSVTRDESYENAFKDNSPTEGQPDQFSTLITQTPGGVVISGEEHDGIPRQKNAFQFRNPNHVAIVGFVLRDVLRTPLTTDGLDDDHRLLIDFVGAAGAGTNGESCANFQEAASGWCSNAGMRINGGQSLFQQSYDWGHNRYGIMTRSSRGSVTRRSFVRLDEHRGDQPYGGFSNYCDTAHRSQDNTVFDSLAVAAPHYKNYAGLEAYPATGCEMVPAELWTEGLLAVNNKLSLSLMDQKAGPAHVWDHIVSYDSEGTRTPQTGLYASWLLQADKNTVVQNSFFGKARGYQGTTDQAGPMGRDIEWGDGVSFLDVPGVEDQGSVPRYLPESLLYFRGRADTFFGDEGYDQETRVRRYPIPGEDLMAEFMGSFSNPAALQVGGGTIALSGDRGATAAGESMSEYFWGYIDALIPPLVVRVSEQEDGTHRIAWERHSGTRRDSVVGWKVWCMDESATELEVLAEDEVGYIDGSGCLSYAVSALYPEGESGIAYIESASE